MSAAGWSRRSWLDGGAGWLRNPDGARRAHEFAGRAADAVGGAREPRPTVRHCQAIRWAHGHTVAASGAAGHIQHGKLCHRDHWPLPIRMAAVRRTAARSLVTASRRSSAGQDR